MTNSTLHLISLFVAIFSLLFSGCLSQDDRNVTRLNNVTANLTLANQTPVPQDIPQDAKLLGLGEEIRLENGLVAFLSSSDNADSAYDWTGIVAFKFGSVPVGADVFKVGKEYQKEGIYFKVLSWDPYLKRARVVFRYRNPIQNK